MMLTKDRIKYDKFDLYSYTYEILNCKFSSNLYEVKIGISKENTQDLP